MPSSNLKREFATEVVRRLRQAGYLAYWAGGCVRDLLLGLEPKDYDVATNARPEKVRELFGYRRTRAVGASFGVILVRGPRGAGQVEVATFRSEGSYLDGRRPSSVTFSTPEEDARRRDFTINGMFYDPLEQKVLDFVGGERDLGAGVIRAIGNPRERMAEDKLRMLRAVRFAATLEFELDPATAEAIRAMAGEILIISVERITEELRRMLTDRHRMRAMQLARDTGLLQPLFPELSPMLGEPLSSPSPEWEVTLHMLNLLQHPPFEVAAASLLQGLAAIETVRETNAGEKEKTLQVQNEAIHKRPATTGGTAATEKPEKTRDGEGEGPVSESGGQKQPAISARDHRVAEVAHGICRRLRMSNRETNAITFLLEQRHVLDAVTHMPLCQLKRLLVQPLFDDLLAFVRAERLARNLDLQPVLFVEEYLRHTPPEEINPPDLLSGDDLRALGLTPGPHFRDLLDAVRDAQLNGEIGTREEAIALVKQLQQNAAKDGNGPGAKPG